ncbi:MAG: AAA family ATPase, partial [Gemmatimonadaceae bacterium]
LTSAQVADVIYDRCPADFLAYLSALGAHDSVSEWLRPAADALATLDLIVFVPIEQPDRIADVAGADRLRRNADALLREILVEDDYEFGRPVVRVNGSPTERARQVVDAMAR